MSNFKHARKYHFIYKTTNLINGKYYIGMHSTNELNDGYIGSGKRLWYSINKYGIENFICEILEFLPDRNALANREKELVNEDTLIDPDCMNLQTGGGGGFSSKEHAYAFHAAGGKAVRILMGKRHAKRMKTDLEYKTKVVQKIKETLGGVGTFTGRKHKPETIEKMKLAAVGKGIGKKNSQFGTCWITNNVENKKIKKIELNNFIELGWRLGRIFL